MEMKKIMVIAFVLASLFGAPLLVIASGWTFGQRCSKLYQDAQFELCINRLVNGGPLYEQNIGKLK